MATGADDDRNENPEFSGSRDGWRRHKVGSKRRPTTSATPIAPTFRAFFVERRFEPEFRATSASLDLVPQLVTRVAGFNINGGRRLDIGAYVTSP